MSTQLAQRGGGGGNALARVFEDARDRLAAALPAHMTPERTLQVLSIIAYRTPKLAECQPESIITSVVQAATLDLDLTPGMNEGYLVPRWNKKINGNECQFQPGYKGLEKLAVRTGAVRYIQAREVYAADSFEVWHEDDRTHYRHKPAIGSNRGDLLYIYAVAKMADGAPLVEVMTVDEIEDIHRRSESYRNAVQYNKEESGPWVTDWLAMGRKTVIRKLCKSLPRVSADPAAVQAFAQLNQAIEADNAQYEDWREAKGQLPKPQNNSGYGHGMYASPEDSERFAQAMKGYLVKVNGEWLDRLDRLCRGEVPDKIRELNEYQADAHLLKWAVETGRLDPSIVPEDAKVRQRYRFTAIVYHRTKDDRKAITQELARYAEQHWHRQLDALTRLRPDLAEAINGQFGEPEEQAEDAADPEFDYEPGSDG